MDFTQSSDTSKGTLLEYSNCTIGSHAPFFRDTWYLVFLNEEYSGQVIVHINSASFYYGGSEESRNPDDPDDSDDESYSNTSLNYPLLARAILALILISYTHLRFQTICFYLFHISRSDSVHLLHAQDLHYMKQQQKEAVV